MRGTSVPGYIPLCDEQENSNNNAGETEASDAGVLQSQKSKRRINLRDTEKYLVRAGIIIFMH